MSSSSRVERTATSTPVIVPNLATSIRVGGALIVALWALLRMRTIAATWDDPIIENVDYYHRSLGETTGYDTLGEYPVPLVGWLRLLNWLAQANHERFFMLFLVACAATDLAMLLALIRRAGQISRADETLGVYALLGPLTWVVAMNFGSPLAYHRLDLFPAVLVGVSLLLMTRPAMPLKEGSEHAGVPPLTEGAVIASAATLAVAAELKLWPLALVPLLLAVAWRVSNRYAGLFAAAFTSVAGAITLWSLALAGWSRFINPFINQGERGLQTESVWATLPVISRLSDPYSTYHVFEYGAHHVHGPGVASALLMSKIATLLGGLFILWLAWRLLPRGRALLPQSISWLTNRGDLAEVAAARARLVAAKKVDDAATDAPTKKAKGAQAAAEGEKKDAKAGGTSSTQKPALVARVSAWLGLEDPAMVAVLGSMAVGIVLTSSPVFSTQFIVWLLAPLAVLATVSAHKPSLQRTAVVAAAILGYLTSKVYPELYWKFVSYDPVPVTEPYATWVLAARNFLVVAFTLYLCAVAFLSTSRRGHKP
ncbi:hypothetical protein ABYF32_08275 [Buchananella felis]|uniref:hypothetical protein n=1 Tax=Buchananella felis TaxID=3231492 RepID=UPI0035271086